MLTNKIGNHLSKPLNPIGTLCYDCCKEQVQYKTQDRVLEIDKRKLANAQRKFSPPRKPPEESFQSQPPYEKRGSSVTTNLSVVELGNLLEENYEDPDLYFGEEAKDNFWSLYKSERRFKDFDIGTD
jgi:hypothetical protein